MGEVYRAEDTRVERQVAIKVLPGEQRLIPVELPFALAYQSFAVAPDGTALYYRAGVESNIWMMERSR